MRDQTVGRWLEALASSAPAPGGGAAAALNAAVGAALIEMACNLTIGRPRYAQHEAGMRAALAEATKLRSRALDLAAADVKAFGAVSEAYKLPKETDEQRQARTEQIQRALVGATETPLNTAVLAGAVIQLARRIVDGANVNALADVAAAAVAARAALEAALINVGANLAAINDPSCGKELSERMTGVSWLAAEAERLVRSIRSRINGSELDEVRQSAGPLSEPGDCGLQPGLTRLLRPGEDGSQAGARNGYGRAPEGRLHRGRIAEPRHRAEAARSRPGQDRAPGYHPQGHRDRAGGEVQRLDLRRPGAGPDHPRARWRQDPVQDDNLPMPNQNLSDAEIRQFVRYFKWADAQPAGSLFSSGTGH